MNKTIVRRETQPETSQLTDLHPVLQRVYAARQITSSDDLDRELSGLIPYQSLLNIDKACERLHQALDQQQKILIVGDFDADGATSSAVAVSALKDFGAEHVDYLVPNRFEFGYGLTPPIIDVALDNKPDLIITVDNGIASHDGVAHANSLGIDVLVTDHHLPADTLPDAVAIVNPNLPGDPFPSKSLAGVGVIFYVMVALRAYLKSKNWFQLKNLDCPNMADYLDFVALGTIADVVSLDKNNRILVYQGLRRIRAGHLHTGLKSLLDVAGKDQPRITAIDLGYSIGPRLNAAGRLDDMRVGISCLLEEDPIKAHELALELDTLNRQRRTIEGDMQREAFDAVTELQLDKKMPVGVCLYNDTWHQGVIGLVASRVKEKLYRPVIAFAKVENGEIKGSARSVKGLHIRDILDSIAKAHPDILSKFGGHSMAAGLCIEEQHYEAFKKAFEQTVAQKASEEILRDCVETDGELMPDNFTFELAALLREAGPWGQDFPEPRFDGDFHLLDQHIVGQRHLKMTLQVPGTDHFLDAIAFNVDTDKWPNQRCEKAHLVYRLDINQYCGRSKLQLLVEEIREDVHD